jgi:hypothetical protein
MGLSRTLLTAVASAMVMTLSGCVTASKVPTDSGIGALHGRVGPGAPPAGDVPATLDVLFVSGSEQLRTTAREGEYEIQLPAGTWDVRTGDGKACSLDVEVQGATRQRLDLAYPADCRLG